MINADPLRRQIAERGLTVIQFSQLTGMSPNEVYDFLDGKRITAHNVESICRMFRCQPCDILEFSKSETKGHWEWVADSEK